MKNVYEVDKQMRDSVAKNKRVCTVIEYIAVLLLAVCVLGLTSIMLVGG